MSESKCLGDFDTVTQYLLYLRPKSIFDAGFGDLKWLEWCLKHRIQFEGVEIDAELVAKGRKKYPNHAKILHQGDVTQPLQFADNSYDVVLLVEVIEHIRNPELVVQTLKECVRVARHKVIMTTPNCSDSDLLRQYGLTYLHYTHVATDGMKFTKDKVHRHWIRFTFENLTELLAKNFTHFVVVPKRPIKILRPVCYDKLWAEIDTRKEKGNV